MMTTCPATRLEAADSPFRIADTVHDLWAGDSVDAKSFAAIRRRVLLEACKWDPQVGDSDTLAPFPLILKSSVWRRIAAQAGTTHGRSKRCGREEISRRPAFAQLSGIAPRFACGAGRECRIDAGSGPRDAVRFSQHDPGLENLRSEQRCAGGIRGGISFHIDDGGLFSKSSTGRKSYGLLDDGARRGRGPIGRSGHAFVRAWLHMEDHQVSGFSRGATPRRRMPRASGQAGTD